MPQRSLSHQQEDESRWVFRSLFPRQWVVRDKVPDYGIDQEVELFNDDGSSTGVVFLAQLRATDAEDALRQSKTRISIEQLRYFASHDLPVLIFRYAAETGTYYFRWAHELTSEALKSKAKTLTIKFDEADAWNPESPAQVRQRLMHMRWLRSQVAAGTLPLLIRCDGVAPSCRYDVLTKLRSAFDSVALFRTVDVPAADGLNFECIVDDQRVSICVGQIGSYSAPIDLAAGAGAVANGALYSACALLVSLKLPVQAAELGRAIWRARAPAPAREHAYFASVALLLDFPAAFGLAALNSLDVINDESYIWFAAIVSVSPYKGPDREDFIVGFFESAAKCRLAGGDPDGAATCYYNIANVLRSARRLTLAVSYYNRARKMSPSYLKRPYFWRELAGVLFLAGKFRCAANAYAAGLTEDRSEVDSFCYADSLLFSGEFLSARTELCRITHSERFVLNAEVMVKGVFCDWLAKWTGRDGMDVRPSEAQTLLSKVVDYDNDDAYEAYEKVLRTMDPFNCLCAFNLGVRLAHRQEHFDAAMLFLVAAFRLPNDTEAWSNASMSMINFATQAGPAGDRLNLLGAVLAVAYFMGGEDAFAHLRRLMLQQNMPDGLGTTLDEMLEYCRSSVRSDQGDKEMLLRFVSPERTEPDFILKLE